MLKHSVEDPNTTAQVVFVNKDSAIEFGSYRDQKIDLYEIKWLDKNPAAQVRSA